MKKAPSINERTAAVLRAVERDRCFMVTVLSDKVILSYPIKHHFYSGIKGSFMVRRSINSKKAKQ